MFQLLLVTLMSMIGWVRPTTTPFSHIPGPTTSALPHIPRPCCTHSVFQAVLGEIGGVYVSNASQAIPIDGWNKLFYDYDRKLMALEAHDRSLGRYQTVNIVMDFNTKKQYITDNGRCTIVDIHEEMQHPCVPGSATYLGSSYFGYGEERVEFVSWEFPTRSSDVMVKLTVSSRNCIPITEAMYGTLRGVLLYTILFGSEKSYTITDCVVACTSETPGATCWAVQGHYFSTPYVNSARFVNYFYY